MRVITTNRVDHVRVMGRDIISARPSQILGESEDEIKYPFRWFEPYISDGIGFRDGNDSYGDVPSNHDNIFPYGNRICLVETLNPLTEYSRTTPPSDEVEVLSVTGVNHSSSLQVIPSPYESTPSIIRQTYPPTLATPEVFITVLGYANDVLGLAIGERLRYTKPSDPDILVISRYPYELIPISNAGYSLDSLSDADEYYYTEEEYLAAVEALP